MNGAISDYNEKQDSNSKMICELLEREIRRVLPDAEAKVWHAHPVWFIDGNPLAGYQVRKHHVTLHFWSGQSFDEPGLAPSGTFKMSEAHYTAIDQIDVIAVERWLGKARDIQWDYKNIVQRKGVLERLK
ncbi:MAG: DUF1801 domain-containing protein [Thermomicrobiales bacterium]